MTTGMDIPCYIETQIAEARNKRIRLQQLHDETIRLENEQKTNLNVVPEINNTLATFGTFESFGELPDFLKENEETVNDLEVIELNEPDNVIQDVLTGDIQSFEDVEETKHMPDIDVFGVKKEKKKISKLKLPKLSALFVKKEKEKKINELVDDNDLDVLSELQEFGNDFFEEYQEEYDEAMETNQQETYTQEEKEYEQSDQEEEIDAILRAIDSSNKQHSIASHDETNTEIKESAIPVQKSALQIDSTKKSYFAQPSTLTKNKHKGKWGSKYGK